MDSNTHAKKRNKKGIGSHYHSRYEVVHRIIAASIGGYALSVWFTILFSHWGNQQDPANAWAATQYSFLVFTFVFIWAFCADSLKKLWLGVTFIFVLIALVVGASYVV